MQVRVLLGVQIDNQMYTVYAILSQKDGRIYVGFTSNIEKRLKEHNAGTTKSTKGFRPWELLYTEVVKDRVTARKREVYWKSGTGKEQLKELKGYLPAGREQEFPMNYDIFFNRPHSSRDRTRVS